MGEQHRLAETVRHVCDRLRESYIVAGQRDKESREIKR